MNEHQTYSFYDFLNVVLVYVQAHYIYYLGALIGMLLDNKPWLKYEFLKFVIAVIILAHLAENILISNGTSVHITILICSVVGIIGHPTVRYILSEALPKILDAITDKIVDKIKFK